MISAKATEHEKKCSVVFTDTMTGNPKKNEKGKRKNEVCKRVYRAN